MGYRVHGSIGILLRAIRREQRSKDEVIVDLVIELVVLARVIVGYRHLQVFAGIHRFIKEEEAIFRTYLLV